MPMKDAPMWTMPEPCQAAVAEVAPAQRVFLGQLMETLKAHDGVDFNDRFSFAIEVLAAQVNLLVDKVRERREEMAPGRPTLDDSEMTNVVVSALMNHAVLRRLRGDDRV